MIEQSRRQVGQPTTTARSGWYRLVEAGLFALALALGQLFAHVVFVLLRVEPPGAVAGGSATVVTAVWYAVSGALVLSAALIVVGLAVDATRLMRQPDVWSPEPAVYTLAGVVAAPIAAIHYLVRRHRYVPVPAERSFWWVLVVAGLVGPPLLTVAAGSLPAPDRTAAVLLVGCLAAGVPVGIYLDSCHVNWTTDGWRYNTGTLVLVALVGLVVLPALYVAAFVHLGRRFTAVGW